MAPQINFIMAKNEQEYLSNGMELLKKHGVISGYADVVSGTKYKYPNVSSFKNGDIPAAPKGFMEYFKKKYGKKIDSLKGKPVPVKTGQKRDYRNYEILEIENRFLKERLAEKDTVIEDYRRMLAVMERKK